MDRPQRRGREDMLIQAVLTTAAMNLLKLAHLTHYIGEGRRRLLRVVRREPSYRQSAIEGPAGQLRTQIQLHPDGSASDHLSEPERNHSPTASGART